jgi:hypothetical protein
MEETSVVAAIICCKTFSFSLNYLSVPLSVKRIKIADWHHIIYKVQKKTQNWTSSRGANRAGWVGRVGLTFWKKLGRVGLIYMLCVFFLIFD